MLLDVNVLLALAWPNHQFHHRARTWFRNYGDQGWASCAITQLGFIRLSSNPAFTANAKTPNDAQRLMQYLSEHSAHRYIAELPAISEFAAHWKRVAGFRQTTDAYLACVAMYHGTKLLTFDTRIATNPSLRDVVAVIDAVP